MNEIDWGAVLPVVITLGGALAYVLKVSGKWAEWRLALSKRRESRVAKLEAQVDKMVEQRLAELSGRVANQESANTHYRNSIATLEKALSDAHRQYEADRSQWRALQESLERDIDLLRQQQTTLANDLSRKAAELESVRTDMRTANERIRELELKNVALEEENRGLRSTNQLLAGMVERWDKVLPEVSRMLETVTARTSSGD